MTTNNIQGEKKIVVSSPPIHKHYSEETQMGEVCDRVFCPYGFVGISLEKN